MQEENWRDIEKVFQKKITTLQIYAIKYRLYYSMYIKF